MIGSGRRSGVRVTRQCCYGDNLRGGAEVLGSVFLHVVSGDDCHRGAALLVLVGLDVLREVVAAHEALGAFGTLKALFSCDSVENKRVSFKEDFKRKKVKKNCDSTFLIIFAAFLCPIDYLGGGKKQKPLKVPLWLLLEISQELRVKLKHCSSSLHSAVNSNSIQNHPACLCLCFLPPVCVLRCLCSSSLRVNLLPQKIQLQTNGLSPVCQRRWARRWDVFP